MVSAPAPAPVPAPPVTRRKHRRRRSKNHHNYSQYPSFLNFVIKFDERRRVQNTFVYFLLGEGGFNVCFYYIFFQILVGS